MTRLLSLDFLSFNKKRLLALQPRTFALLVLFFVAGCSSRPASDRVTSARTPAPSPQTFASSSGESPSKADDKAHIPPSPKGSSSLATSQPSEAERKLIWQGHLRLSLAEIPPFLARLEPQLRKIQGYVARSEDRTFASRSSVQLELRIPATVFRPFLAWLRSQGAVSHERLWSQDITSEYSDLEARLRNQRHLEARLLQILRDKAAQVKDVLVVEKELARIREGIDRQESQRRLWDRMIAYSTLTLDLDAFTPPESSARSWSGFLGRADRSFRSSLASLSQALQDLTLFLVEVLPWLPFAFLFFWLFRRWRKKKKAFEVSSESPDTGSVNKQRG